jgi:hypothetical protein
VSEINSDPQGWRPTWLPRSRLLRTEWR